MKRIALALAALAVLLVGSQAHAHHVASVGHSYHAHVTFAAPHYSVTAFSLPASYSVQSYALATYQPFALQALPPVVQAADPPPCVCSDPQPQAQAPQVYSAPVTYAAPAGVNLYSASPVYTANLFRFRTAYADPGVVIEKNVKIERGAFGRVRSKEVTEVVSAPVDKVTTKTVTRAGLFGKRVEKTKTVERRR